MTKYHLEVRQSARCWVEAPTLKEAIAAAEAHGYELLEWASKPTAVCVAVSVSAPPTKAFLASDWSRVEVPEPGDHPESWFDDVFQVSDPKE